MTKQIVVLAIVGVACFLPACYDPQLRDCAVACGPGNTCASGQTCNAGFCSSGPKCTPDASADRFDADVGGDADADGSALERPDGDAEGDADASPSTDADASPNPDADASPNPDADASPNPDADASPNPDADASPNPDADASPNPDADASPNPDADASPSPAPTSPSSTAAEAPDAPTDPLPDAPQDLPSQPSSSDAPTVHKFVAACGRGPRGIECAVSNGSEFTNPGVRAPDFNDASGWGDDPRYYSTIQFADVNGDGKRDVCGRGVGGIFCAVSNETAFTGYGLWGPGFSDLGGWASPQYYSTIQFADVNGDGMADVCGRGSNGIDCAVSNGTSFVDYAQWGPGAAGFNDAAGWDLEKYYATIRLADVNGDNVADVCGRHTNGIHCATSDKTKFVSYAQWDTDFMDVTGWDAAKHYSTIQFADVDGDHRADVCGRGYGGMFCAKSTGTAFAGYDWWTAGYRDIDGWYAAQYYSTIRLTDVNGDGRFDVCGRGSVGIICATSTGTAFVDWGLWGSGGAGFNDADGWNVPQYYSTIGFPDVNGDGLSDVCGRGTGGVFCATSTGTSFTDYDWWSSSFSDANGWNLPKYYSTMKYPETVKLIP